MTPHALLLEATTRGIDLYRVGTRLRWCARSQIPGDFLERLRVHREGLLRIVPVREEPHGIPVDRPERTRPLLTADPNKNAMVAADTARRPAVVVGGMRSGPWRVVVEAIRPVASPVQLDAATTVINPRRCIESSLADLRIAVEHKNAGRTTAFTQLIDEYVARLAACGCKVRVEVVA